MKNIRSCSRLLVPIIFALALSLSCDRRVNEQLDSIEDSLSTDPACAYEKLTSISTKQLRSKSTQARYALLMSLAMDKNYIDTDNDSLIRVAVNYYQDGRNTSYKMLSFYSLGIVQRNAHKTTAAIVSFLKSEELAAELSDYHYLGLVYKNMAALYRKCHDVDQELRYFQKSVAAFDKEGASLYSAYSQLEEARAFMARGMFSHADSVYRKVEAYARNNSEILLVEVLMDRAINVISSNAQDARLVISLYEEADIIGGIQKETVDYGTIACAYNLLNVPDSVAHYVSMAESVAKRALTLYTYVIPWQPCILRKETSALRMNSMLKALIFITVLFSIRSIRRWLMRLVSTIVKRQISNPCWPVTDFACLFFSVYSLLPLL